MPLLSPGIDRTSYEALEPKMELRNPSPWRPQPPFHDVKMFSHFHSNKVDGIFGVICRCFNRQTLQESCASFFYLLFLTWEKPHHFDKCSRYDFNKHQQRYDCSKINSRLRAAPWDFCRLPLLQPHLFCGASAERLKKELVYPHTRHKSHAYRLCQHREPHKWPLWLRRKGTSDIEVVLCCLEVGSEQFNCRSCWYTQGSLFIQFMWINSAVCDRLSCLSA